VLYSILQGQRQFMVTSKL